MKTDRFLTWLTTAVWIFRIYARGQMSATSGDFSVLSINVAGLPAMLQGNGVPGDKEKNARLIGSKLAEHNYDVIHMQEDFNYHGAIYETDKHPHRTATSGGVPIGSGLNTVSNFEWATFSRITWEQCSNESGSDCMTPKGFTLMRLAISSSKDDSSVAYVDVYNLHADAGVKDEDNATRQSNMRQLAGYVSHWSAGNAIIVFGDTNSRYSRTADTGIRSLLQSQDPKGPCLEDAWVQLERHGITPVKETLCENPSTTDNCETVDKVFYRSSPLLTIKATAFAYASRNFLQPDGAVLSDHNPINVNFTWSAGKTLRQSGFKGGSHGNWFTDVFTLSGKKGARVASICFRGEKRLDSVAVTLADGTTMRHGGDGGDEKILKLAPGEFWTEAKLCQGAKKVDVASVSLEDKLRIFYIMAATSAGKKLEIGNPTDDCTDYKAPKDWQIVGFIGRDGNEIDQLAFLFAPQGKV